MFVESKAQSKFFTKIPKTNLLGPGGMIGVFLAVFVETSDWFLDLFHLMRPGQWEAAVFPLKTFIDLVYAIFSAFLFGVPISSNIVPFLIERIPILSTILPTWVLRILI